ncbi:MAG: hypothetical protein K2Y42_06245 [Hyphomicrobium sp.]|uniref:hypothetical protein n=1 Tax=Hyphomicrobium sp. TaxID=82 RepID=UPI0025C34A11|nr:hypothetical protein [Hyphomicrobium sp.]MBX9862337.1 hypothetical protein [Hyphomicrobium sp.]
MWNRQKLADLARNRKAALSDVDGALLAFARTQEMTDEAGIDAKTAERELADALDKLEPEAADKLKLLGSVERDEVLRDFLVVMMGHNQKRIERELQEVQELQPTQKLDAPKVEGAAPDKKRKRGLRFFRP